MQIERILRVILLTPTDDPIVGTIATMTRTIAAADFHRKAA
jgi:hypothetical protein